MGEGADPLFERISIAQSKTGQSQAEAALPGTGHPQSGIAQFEQYLRGAERRVAPRCEAGDFHTGRCSQRQQQSYAGRKTQLDTMEVMDAYCGMAEVGEIEA